MMEELKITKKTSIGDVIKQYPEAEAVIKNILGRAALPVRVQKREDIAFGATMHNISPILLLKS